MTIIRLENVNYDYGAGLSFETHALDNISLDIEEGSIVGLIGPTGSGKSTLLQQMNGLLRPSSGSVYFRGEDISSRSFDSRTLCSRVGIVFQYPEYQLFSEDVISDVMFGPLNIGLSHDDARRRAEEALQMMGISGDELKLSPFELSGGQKRRAAIAGVVAMEPEVLVLDEPTAGLDTAGRKDLIDTIISMRGKRKMTVIWSSHSMEDMASYVERLIVMYKGAVVRDGTPADVFRDAQYLEQIGLAVPEASYMIRELRTRGIGVEEGAITLEQAADSIMAAWNRSRKNGLEQL